MSALWGEGWKGKLLSLHWQEPRDIPWLTDSKTQKTWYIFSGGVSWSSSLWALGLLKAHLEPESSFLEAKSNQEQKTKSYLLFLRKSLSQGLLNTGRISRDTLLFFCSLLDTWPWLPSGTMSPLCVGVPGRVLLMRSLWGWIWGLRHSSHHACRRCPLAPWLSRAVRRDIAHTGFVHTGLRGVGDAGPALPEVSCQGAGGVWTGLQLLRQVRALKEKSCSRTGCSESSPCVCAPGELPRRFHL